MGEIGAENHLEMEIDSDIETATSFETLYEAIRRRGIIVGSRKKYTAQEIIDLIELTRKGEVSINYITRSHGIRAAVERLLKIENPTQ